MKRRDLRAVDVTPSASRLTESLRDIGYDFPASVADLVDNSVAAGAGEIDVEIVFDGAASYVLIADDGRGMTASELHEALRFGSRRTYEAGELGRYGLGLKTASIAQCRRVTVISRRALTYRRLAAKTLDLDHVQNADRWVVIDPPEDSRAHQSLHWLDETPGTVVLWEQLDRVLPERRPEGGWARRRLEQVAARTRDYLGMVFHRFLANEACRDRPLHMRVNGEKVRPWDPFAPFEEHRLELPPQSFEISATGHYGRVRLHRYILPTRDRFSSITEFERMSGPLKWNRQQGLYIYRADRLIQHGGWCGIRAADEHTKLARAAIDFQTDLDPLFQINVAKMRVSLPSEVRTLLERPIHELCHRADAVYRREAHSPVGSVAEAATGKSKRSDAAEIGTALMSAALEAGEHHAFSRIMDRLRDSEPGVAASLGW